MKKSQLRKLIRETIKSLLLEVEEYDTVLDAKNNCWQGNADCIDSNGNQLACTQSMNVDGSGTYVNNCGMPIQGGGTLTPNKDKTIPNIKNKNVYKRTNRKNPKFKGI